MRHNTVLIIDDDENDVLIAKRVLSRIDPKIRVEAAPSGEAGLALLQGARELPELVLLDLKMPGMNGFGTLRRIRADERLKDLPVVVVTSSSLDSDLKEAYEAGANSFLHKAFGDQFHADITFVLKRWLKH